jgi:hypothetical protein
MRGKPQAQLDFLTVLNLNATVPTHHPLRAIKRQVDAVFQKLSPSSRSFMSPAGVPASRPHDCCKWRKQPELDACSHMTRRKCLIRTLPSSKAAFSTGC